MQEEINLRTRVAREGDIAFMASWAIWLIVYAANALNKNASNHIGATIQAHGLCIALSLAFFSIYRIVKCRHEYELWKILLAARALWTSGLILLVYLTVGWRVFSI